MRLLICLICACLLTGCTYRGIIGVPVDGGEKEYTFETNKDDMYVKVTLPDGTIIEVDLRGKTTFLEAFAGMWATQMPDMTVHSGDTSD